MDRTSLMLTVAVAALVAVAGPRPVSADPYNGSGNSIAQNFQYSPYNGQNNTPNQPPPQDNYTPSHPAGSVGAGAPYNGGPGSGDAYQAPARQSDDPNADDGSDRAAGPSGDAYAPPRGAPSRGDTYSSPRGDAYPAPPGEPPPRQGDAYSPSRDGAEPPPGSAAEGPPLQSPDGGQPRVEVQAAAPDDGLPYAVREHDARRAAIEGWRGKVSDRFGPEFSHWRMAIGKHVDCHPDRRDGIICTASAQPVRGFDRTGQGPRDGPGDDRD